MFKSHHSVKQNRESKVHQEADLKSTSQYSLNQKCCVPQWHSSRITKLGRLGDIARSSGYSPQSTRSSSTIAKVRLGYSFHILTVTKCFGAIQVGNSIILALPVQGHFIPWGIFSKRSDTLLLLLGESSAPKTRPPYRAPLSPGPPCSSSGGGGEPSPPAGSHLAMSGRIRTHTVTAPSSAMPAGTGGPGQEDQD